MNDTLLRKVRNIHAIGRNYLKHVQELENEIPEEPVLFSKSPASLTHSNTLTFPAHLAPIHYELELVLRIGVSVPVGRLCDLGSVSHMALGIDFTARDLQSTLKKTGLPWSRAKSFRDACFVGPLRKALALRRNFRFSLYQNDELRQDGNSGLMMFDFLRLLKFINRDLPFQEGDLVFTGTPEGVGPVRSGDKLRILCESLATDMTLHIGFE